MMTKNEALRIKHISQYCEEIGKDCYNCLFQYCFSKNEIRTAKSILGDWEEKEKYCLEALEKQVPQKVKKYKGLNETACPECDIAFGYYEYDDEKFDYCYNCGQKLDWESEVEYDG